MNRGSEGPGAQLKKPHGVVDLLKAADADNRVK